MKFGDLKIELRPMFFVDLISPRGFLTPEPACHACWYFYMLAEKARQAVGRGPEDQILETNEESDTNLSITWPLWMDLRYNEQAKSIALLYGLESPDQMWGYWHNVKLTAAMFGLPTPHDSYTTLSGKDRVT